MENDITHGIGLDFLEINHLIKASFCSSKLTGLDFTIFKSRTVPLTIADRPHIQEE